MDLFRRNEPVLQSRDLLVRPAPIPQKRIRDLTPDLSGFQKRASGDNGSSSNKQSSGSSSTMAIAIGVAIPVVIIVVIMLVIWRRRQVISKVEDEREHKKYKSLDFGVDDGAMAGSKRQNTRKGQTEMSVADVRKSLRKDRGLSLDLNTANPYLLPPEVHESRESLHSLSRQINTGDDKYRATTFVPDDGSIRSPSSMSRGDGSSIFTGSTRYRTGTMETESKTDLLPKRSTRRNTAEYPSIQRPSPVAEKLQNGLLAPASHEHDRNSTLSVNSTTAAIRASNNYLGQFISGGQKPVQPKKAEQPGLILAESERQVTPPANEPRELPAAVVRNEPLTSKRSSTYDPNLSGLTLHEMGDSNRDSVYGTQPQTINHQVTIPQIETTSYEMGAETRSQFPQRKQSVHRHDQPTLAATAEHPPVPVINVQHHQTQKRQSRQGADAADDASDYYDEDTHADYQDYMDYTHRGSMMGVRPLPPDDPSENPEQRANRIRSFYKEYFDDSKGGQGPPAAANYYDGSEQYEEYDDFDYGYYEQAQQHSRGPSMRSDTRHRAFSHGSHGYRSPGPRTYSTMSGRAGPGPNMPPKKKLPPPKPLMVLPTPHKLKDDDFLPNAIDFAPPQVFKNQRSGTPDSLRGGMRAYSPSVRPHVPLNSAFDDLADVPSPHALRKSGTFTGLDFAPPRRFREPGESGSDSGSIKSNRSNYSQMHLANIKNGAYRVSRIPKEVAGTRDDMFAVLKPKWDMRGDGAATPTMR